MYILTIIYIYINADPLDADPRRAASIRSTIRSGRTDRIGKSPSAVGTVPADSGPLFSIRRSSQTRRNRGDATRCYPHGTRRAPWGPSQPIAIRQKRVCVRACACACVRACVRARARTCVRACVPHDSVHNKARDQFHAQRRRCARASACALGRAASRPAQPRRDGQTKCFTKAGSTF